MSNKNTLLEKEEDKITQTIVKQSEEITEKIEEPKKEENLGSTFQPVVKNQTDVMSIFTLLVAIFIGILLIIFILLFLFVIFLGMVSLCLSQNIPKN